MTNQDNIVKIGTAPKWRGVYDDSKKYYQENLVTLNGSVFRCKILSAQGFSPVKIDEETRYISYANPDVWEVVVDMAYYYNYVIGQENFNNMILDIVTKHDKEIQDIKQNNLVRDSKIEILSKAAKAHHNQINELKRADKNLQNQIQNINETDRKQQEEIDGLKSLVADLEGRLNNLAASNAGKAVSVVSYGQWDNTLPWINSELWNNYPTVQGSCSCDSESMMKQLNELQETIKKQGETIEELLRLLRGSNPVRVKHYDEILQAVALEGAITIKEGEEPDSIEVSAPLSKIDYDELEQSIAFN